MACILSGAYADLPAAGTANRLFLPTDGTAQYRDTGAAWVPWGPLFPMAHPVDGDFSWVNQGTATVDDSYGGICLTAPAGLGASLRIRVKTAPATPYTVSTAILALAIKEAGGRGTYGGLCWRQSSDGKLVLFYYTGINSYLYVTKFTDPTTFSAVYAQQEWSTRDSFMFMRIEDDGTDRICSWSENGQDWIEFHSVGRTDFLTADQIGFFAGTQVTVTSPHQMTLLHWKET